MTNLVLLVGLVAPLLLATYRVSAQGTNGTLPDPIAARELDEYARRLGLSTQQRQAVALFHDEYRAAFAQLRETDIEHYLREQPLGGGFRVGGSVDELERQVRDLEGLMTRISNLDRSFFDQVQTALTEQQLVRMPRIRQMRERLRHRTGALRFAQFMNPAARLDMSDVFFDLDLTPDALAQVDPLVAEYERQFTSALRDMYKRATNQQLDAVRRMQEMGLDASSDRPGDRRRYFSAFREVWAQMNRQLMEQAGELSTLNQRAMRSWSPLLPDDAARTLKQRYIDRAYGEAAPIDGPAVRRIDVVLGFEELPDDMREQVEALRLATMDETDRITDQMVQRIDENRSSRSVMEFNPDAYNAYREELAALEQRRDEANHRAIETLNGLIGAEMVARVDEKVRDPRTEIHDGEIQVIPGMVARVRVLNDGDDNVFITDGPVALSFVARDLSVNVEGAELADPYLPGPVSADDIHRWGDWLGVEPAMMPVLESLHEDYKLMFRDVQEHQIKAVRDAQRSLWKRDPESNAMTPPTEDEVDELYTLRRRALQAIRNTDAVLMNNIELTVGNEDNALAMRRVRLARERQMYNRGDGLMEGATFFGAVGGRVTFAGPGGDSHESSVDLASIIHHADPPFELDGAMSQALTQYEQNVTETFREAFEANFRAQEAMEKLAAQNAGMDDGPRRGMRASPPGDDEDRELAREAQQQIRELNRQTLARFEELMPADEAHRLRDLYNRQAFPSVFADPRSVDSLLDRTAALEDLTPDQRMRLTDLMTSHRAEYEDLCDQMVQVHASSVGSPRGGFEGMQERMQTLEKLRFTRNDLNDRTLARLRGLLTEAQIEQLGGLKRDDNTGGNFSYEIH